MVAPLVDRGERSTPPAPTPAPTLAAEPIEASGESIPPPPREAAEQLAERLREEHPWARFEPGAWRKVRIVSEAFDERGQVVGGSLAEQTDRLVSIDSQSYTIQTERVVTLAGRSTRRPIETRRLSLWNDLGADAGPLKVTRGDRTSISLGGVAVPSQAWELEQHTPAGLEVETLYTSLDGPPLVLRREQQSIVDDSPATLRVYAVVRRGQPLLMGESLVESWQTTETIEQTSGARSETLGVYTTQAPGGLVHETLNATDAAGTRARWAVTELVEWGRDPDETLAYRADGERGPSVEIEIRPRQLLRMLRRGEPE
ncbi:hypothetical protein [Botrimarina sp.]|uniref:hypothetical protein n=1 Tax=Botrimarina sp. TaxID=2795802 RepID=UPI0032EB11DB